MFVRTAGPRDIDAVRALLMETWHDTYDGIHGVDRVTAITDDWHSVAALKARLDKPGSEYLVADDGKQIAGMAFASVVDDGKTVMLHQLYVRPGMQGRGVGGMLFEEISSCFPDAEKVRLEVDEQNAKALAFYQALGFSEVARTENCGKDQSGIPALVLECPILWAD